MNEQLISKRLKSAREKLGITKAEASRRLNLSKIGYCRYEYGERIPSMQTLEVIAQCFETSVDYLIGLSDDPSASRIIVDKEQTPELFELIELCKNDDSDQIKRLLGYYKKIAQQ